MTAGSWTSAGIEIERLDVDAADGVVHLTGSVTSGESFAVRGREIYCHLPMGVANSLLGSGKLEKLLGLPITARNWRTVTKLA